MEKGTIAIATKMNSNPKKRDMVPNYLIYLDNANGKLVSDGLIAPVRLPLGYPVT